MDKLKRNKNLKIDSVTHSILKKYCEANGLKMFAFVEKLIRDRCSNISYGNKDSLYND